MCHKITLGLAVVSIMALGLLTNLVAAPINYGDFTGMSVMYLDVTETANTPDDDEPLFGGPSIVANQLDFDPSGFSASSTNMTSDLTDGQLNFGLMGLPGVAINQIIFGESGDYSLLGVGSVATSVTAALSLSRVTVFEVDGVALSSPVSFACGNASLSLDLVNNGGALRSWGVSVSCDLDAALTNRNVPFDHGATKLELVLDNSLSAISEPSSIAFIAKKDFRIDVNVESFTIPEPSCLTLVGFVLGGLATIRRRAH